MVDFSYCLCMYSSIELCLWLLLISALAITYIIEQLSYLNIKIQTMKMYFMNFPSNHIVHLTKIKGVS
jgi:hypothetical protein